MGSIQKRSYLNDKKMKPRTYVELNIYEPSVRSPKSYIDHYELAPLTPIQTRTD